MLYMGLRHTVPSSRYARELNIIDATGWTYDQVLAAPADLIDEIEARLRGKAIAARRQEQQRGRRA